MGKARRRKGRIEAAATFMLAGALAITGSMNALAAGGNTDALVLIDEQDLKVTITADDDDLTDGFTLKLHMENHTGEDLAFSFTDTALNGYMCDTDYWGTSSWAVPAGETEEAELTWIRRDMDQAKIEVVRDAVFTVQIYSEDMGDLKKNYLVNDSYELTLPSLTKAGETDSEPESLVEVWNDADANCEVTSRETTEDGTAVLTLYMENKTNKPMNFSVTDVLADGYAISTDFSRTVRPLMKAYGQIPLWNLEVDAAKIADASQLSFEIVRGTEEAGVNGYTDFENKQVTVLLKDERSEETEAVTERAAEEGETILVDTDQIRIILQGAERALGYGYASVDLYLENKTDQPMVISSDSIVIKDVEADPYYSTSLPASSRKEVEVLCDGGSFGADVDRDGEMSIRLTAKSEDGSIISDDYYVVMEGNKVEETTEGMTEDAQETQSEKETEIVTEAMTESEAITESEAMTESENASGETGDAYTDHKTICNIQWALRINGFDPGSSDGVVGPVTRGCIESYAEKMGLSSGSRITKELLKSLGMVDYDTFTQVQQALNDKGYDAGPVDGYIGTKTRTSIRQFREDEGLGEGDLFDDELLTALHIEF